MKIKSKLFLIFFFILDFEMVLAGKLNDDKSPMERIDPPDNFRNGIREPVKLLAQMIYFLIIFVPYIVWDWIEYFFFTKRKSVKGKVVLVISKINRSSIFKNMRSVRLVAVSMWFRESGFDYSNLAVHFGSLF